MAKDQTRGLRMRAMFFVAIAALCLSACNKPSGTTEKVAASSDRSISKIPLDLTSPDNALKSYWAAKDEVRRAVDLKSDEETAFGKEVRSLLEKVAAPGIFDFNHRPVLETFSRDIEDVDVQSETRAVIIARIKNITPIPAGAEVDEYDKKARENGERYRYVLEKSAAGWRVAELWTWSTYPKEDWKKSRPSDGKPSVPTFTFEGS